MMTGSLKPWCFLLAAGMILTVFSPARAQLDHFRIFDADSASPKTAGAFFPITLYALDINGNIVSSYNGTTILSDVPWGVAYITPQNAAFSNGVANNVPVSLLRAGGPDSIWCNDGLGHSGYSHGYTILAGAYKRLQVLLPGQSPDPGNRNDRGRSGSPPVDTAGERFKVRTFSTDSLWNPVPSLDVIHLASTDSFMRGPPDHPLVNGRDSSEVSLRAAGISRVIVSDQTVPGTLPDTSTAVTVVPAPFEKLLLLGPGEKLLPGDTTTNLGGTPGNSGTVPPQGSGTPFGITAMGVDSCWNLVTNAPGDIVGINPLNMNPVIQPPSAPLVGGKASYTVTVSGAGNLFLVAKDETNGNIIDSYALDVPISGRIFLIKVSPDSVLSGDPFTISAAYVTSRGDTLRQNIDARFSAVLNSDSTQAGTGTLELLPVITDTIIHLVNGVVTQSARYSTNHREAIRIRLQNNSAGASGISGNAILVIPILQAGEQIVNYPNPFGYNQPTTTIRYILSQGAAVNLSIYDLFGNPVLHRSFAPGTPGGQGGPVPNTFIWDGKNDKGRNVGSGTYILRLRATKSAETIADYTRRIAVVR
jgi:hypothetical protein